MRYTLLTCLFLCLFNIINGQTHDTFVIHNAGTSFSVKGHVTDKASNKPIKGAVLHMVGSDGSDELIKTDSNGFYMFDVKHGGGRYVMPNTSYILSADASDQQYLTSPIKASFTTNGEASKAFIEDFQLQQTDPCWLGCMPKLEFSFGKAEMNGLADSLSFLLKLLKDNPAVSIQLNGNASADEQNKTSLSLARANACRHYLISQGIDSARITTKGWGATKPLPGCSSAEIKKMKFQTEKDAAYQADRRVNFFVTSFKYKVQDKQ